MDAFEVHRRLIEDYRTFSEGFVDVHDERIRARVEQEGARGAQWPAPWSSLNPSFASGGRVDDLVREGLLHQECSRIFRVKKASEDRGSVPITLHRHQSDAVRVARTGASYVLTTGTGSGKSLAYMVPIVDRVLREGSGQGVRAIVVYPMNALANSQREEMRKFLEFGYDGRPPVTFARYTGQETEDERRAILRNPPDILLTNYVMLELVLTRPDERRPLVEAAHGLRFLVLDELHTYRGRQGADVAMLVRRVRDACGAGQSLQCVHSTIPPPGPPHRHRHRPPPTGPDRRTPPDPHRRRQPRPRRRPAQHRLVTFVGLHDRLVRGATAPYTPSAGVISTMGAPIPRLNRSGCLRSPHQRSLPTR
ncbi:DEAD/DEAH box helicase [Micromonospora carbonacea]|uniref:DEAD/DEAH box helicase n=1 Tax=Micromonospora carbonacea TaxID=47853 RepID=UPI0033290EC6